MSQHSDQQRATGSAANRRTKANDISDTGCNPPDLTTDQKVGSSNLSGRAQIVAPASSHRANAQPAHNH